MGTSIATATWPIRPVMWNSGAAPRTLSSSVRRIQSRGAGGKRPALAVPQRARDVTSRAWPDAKLPCGASTAAR